MKNIIVDSDEKIKNPHSSNCETDYSPNNCVYYGPIRFYRRKGKPPTLLTGRKSKFEELTGEEYVKRQVRREKNRLLSKKLKEKRDSIENELLQKINELEKKNCSLLNHIGQLHSYKTDLSQKLEHSNEDPLVHLINEEGMTLFFEEYDHEDIDTDSLISILTDEQSSLDDLLSPMSQ